MRRLVLTLTLLTLGACSSTGAKTDLPSHYVPAESVQLTDVGENLSPQFHPSGARLLFSSRSRPAHSTSQIYELNLETQALRRITFQDGEATHPSYLPSGDGIAYASTTDEIKETPLFLNQLIERYGEQAKATPSPLYPPQEIYISHLDGSFIKRLTYSPGYDGKPAVHPQKPKIVFSSFRTHRLELFELTGTTFNLSKLTSRRLNCDEARFSGDGKTLAWIESTTQAETSRVIVADETGAQAKILPLPVGHYRDVSLNQDGTQLLFSARLAKPGKFSIYHYDLVNKCLRRLTDQSGTDITPAFRPGEKQIVYASNRSGLFHLYLMDFKPAKDCLSL